MQLRELLAGKLIPTFIDVYSGTSIQNKAKFLSKSQWWSKQKLEELQLTKLRHLVKHAYHNVPFYKSSFKKCGLYPSDLRSLDDISKIPILTKYDVRQNAEKLVATNYRRKDLLSGRTGGSTGEPLQFFRDRNARSWAWGAMERYYRWLGLRPGEGKIVIGGGSLGGYLAKGRINTLLTKLSNQVLARHFFSVLSLDKVITKEIAHIAKCTDTRILSGYPSGLYVLAKYAQQKNLSFDTIKICLSTAERLYEFQRETIESVFSADLYDQYGCGEIHAIAAQCSNKGVYHAFDEHVIVERPNDIGGSQKRAPARITNLDNYAMPFIRYENGDVLCFSNNRCDCGRNLSTIEKIEGRTHDFLVTTQGSPMPGEFIPHLFQKVVGFDRYFVYQKTKHQIEVRIVKNNRFSLAELDILVQKMKTYLGKDMEIQFEYVDEIQLPSSGKLSFIESDVEPVFD